MNLEFSEEQVLLMNLVERFTTDYYDLLRREEYVKSTQGFYSENWEKLAETGILTVPFSETHGGLGGTVEDLICIMQPLGRAVAVEPMLTLPILTGSLLERVGTDSQKSDWIPKIIAGKSHIALAHSEPAARYDLDFVKTSFSKSKDLATVSGKKTFVLGGASADAFIVSAVSSTAGASSEHIEFFLVKKNARGLTHKSYRLIDGSIAYELSFNDTPAEPMNGTFDDFLAIIARTKIAACAEMVGLMELLLEDTLTHVKTRQQFGRVLSKMQVIQHRLADAHVSLELCRSHLLRMAASNEADPDYERMTSGSKAFISEAAVALAEDAIQLHGGMGTTNELIIGHAVKRILLLATLFGDVDTEIARFSQPKQTAA